MFVKLIIGDFPYLTEGLLEILAQLIESHSLVLNSSAVYALGDFAKQCFFATKTSEGLCNVDLPVNIICMKWGSKYGANYVNTLYAMIARHIAYLSNSPALLTTQLALTHGYKFVNCLP